jgi:hypothetical protein
MSEVEDHKKNIKISSLLNWNKIEMIEILKVIEFESWNFASKMDEFWKI